MDNNYNPNSSMNNNAMANSMILGHVGVIVGVLFVFVSWRGAKI